ncbi:hypothetical protein BRD19_07845 [Halobacteriales archaeon SW_7_65_23]|nr:MAG: hypothetical protein BRD19_07845 [Halobacteriales archaeon SW_7_65_23]
MTRWEINSLRDFFEVVLENYPESHERFTYGEYGSDEDQDYRVGEENIDDYRDLIHETGHQLVEAAVDDRWDVQSVAQTNLADIPYIAIMHPSESKSTTYGRYVVYLFDPARNRAYLSLGIGASVIGDYAEAIPGLSGGRRTQVDILEWLALWYRNQITVSEGIKPGPIDFDDSLRRGDSYGSGTICYRGYSLDNLPDNDTLIEDLQELLEIYKGLIETRVQNINVTLGDKQAWHVSTEDYRWPTWDAHDIVSIGHELDPDEFSRPPVDLKSIEDSSFSKTSGQGQAYRFTQEMSEGDFIVAAIRGKSNTHRIRAVGRIMSTNLEDSEPSIFDVLENESHFHSVQWLDFGAQVPITLGTNIPLTDKTVTELTADELSHVLGTTMVYLVAAGLYENVGSVVSAITDKTQLDITVNTDATIDDPAADTIETSTFEAETDEDTAKNEGWTLGDIDWVTLAFDLEPDDIALETLHFKDETELLEEAIDALSAGNHLLFVGPPGTGKSDLAQILSEALVEESYELTTATADWSTFDTIGGYRQQSRGDLAFAPGVFLSRFQDDRHRPTNEWLIIDEFNRANIDKAFGSLFSVLTGDDVLLPFSEEGDDIRVYGSEPDQDTVISSTDYVVPDDWRLLATMNTFDKSSLYDLSYALSRRFSYIHVPAPTAEEIDQPLVKAYVNCWEAVDPDPDLIEAVTELWKAVQEERPLGPAIIRDVLLAANVDLTRGVVQHVLPQYEGLMNRTQETLLENISETGHVDTDRIEVFGQQYFGLTDLDL